MIRTRIGAAAVLGAAALALSGCSTGSAGGGADAPQSSVAAVNGAGKTLTVWEMDGDYSTATLDAIDSAFTKATGAKVDLQVQEWTGITTKITTALATSNPPDVLDLGNTQVASFASNGGLLDLSSYATDLKQGQTWLGGLVEPATVNGSLYAVPGFAGARAVIYNKSLWAAAGITTVPTSYAQLTADLDKVKAANHSPSFSAFYLPGQDWYGGMQFVWDAGGQIATQANGTWTSGFASAQAQAGLAAFKSFQNAYSTTGSRTLDTATPDQNQVFADGQAGAILSTSSSIATIEKDNSKLSDADLGTFPFPGLSGHNQPVMLGGSDWGIAAKSANAALAVEWAKIAAGPQIEQQWVLGHDGWIPNSTESVQAAASSVPALDRAFFTAALNSEATPASPNWAQIEGAKNINNLFSSIASGTATAQAAAGSFDASADPILNTAN